MNNAFYYKSLIQKFMILYISEYLDYIQLVVDLGRAVIIVPVGVVVSVYGVVDFSITVVDSSLIEVNPGSDVESVSGLVVVVDVCSEPAVVPSVAVAKTDVDAGVSVVVVAQLLLSYESW